MPRFNIISVFPEFFVSPLATSLLGKAIANGLIEIKFYNPRDYTRNKRGSVDDRPFGGGPGMVMRPEPVRDALNAIANPGVILLMSPAGKPLTGKIAAELARKENITLICGRYEGVDERVCDLFPVRKISVCDAVLNGGETAALATLEAACRFVPGFMHDSESAADESFSNSALEYPHFTRPEVFENMAAPPVLLSGDHARVNAWRRRQSLLATLENRPDLLDAAPLNARDAEWLREFPRVSVARNLSFALLHYPVRLGKGVSGASSLTNLDIHDIARISRSYGMGPFYALTPLKDQLELLSSLLAHWERKGGDRSAALHLVRPVSEFGEIRKMIERDTGREPLCVLTSARWPGKGAPPPLAPAEIRNIARDRPVLLCLGTARGLDEDALDFEYARLRPLRFLSDNHLPVRAAAAIIADRILGDFY